jgi:Rrf2 family transcriptional repressor of oqxAB
MPDTRFSNAFQIVATVGIDTSLGRRSTSNSLAADLNTNPSFVRRIVSPLSKAGILQTSNGSSGGVILARDPKSITIEEIYKASLPDAKLWVTRSSLPATSLKTNNFAVVADALAGQAMQAIMQSLSEVTLQQCLDEITAANETSGVQVNLVDFLPAVGA